MKDKELYRQKMQAQLDLWKAELAKMKAKAEGASADRKLKFNQQVERLESDLKKGEQKLNDLAGASEEAWGSIKEGVESAWGSLRTSFSDAASKFKD